MLETITNHLALIDARARLRGIGDIPRVDELTHSLNRALGDTRGAITDAIGGLADSDAAYRAYHAFDDAEEYTAVLVRLDRALEAVGRIPDHTVGVTGSALGAMLAHRRETMHDLARATTALYVYTRGDA